MAYIQDKNGKYKRTVRCGFCYKIGHNKSSCPEKKQMHQDSIAKYKKMLEGEDLTVLDRQHTERLLASHTKQLDKSNNRGKNRRCGFCGDFGHTRRTCKERKDKLAEKLEQTLDVRERMRDALLDIGYGPGALVNVTVRDARYLDGVLGVVKSVDFKEIQQNHVYDGGSWAPMHNHNVTVKLLQPIKDYWGTEYDEVNVSMPISVLNLDGHELHHGFVASMRDRDHLSTLVSSSECSKKSFNSDDFDTELVSKWVLKNIVDP